MSLVIATVMTEEKLLVRVGIVVLLLSIVAVAAVVRRARGREPTCAPRSLARQVKEAVAERIVDNLAGVRPGERDKPDVSAHT